VRVSSVEAGKGWLSIEAEVEPPVLTRRVRVGGDSCSLLESTAGGAAESPGGAGLLGAGAVDAGGAGGGGGSWSANADPHNAQMAAAEAASPPVLRMLACDGDAWSREKCVLACARRSLEMFRRGSPLYLNPRSRGKAKFRQLFADRGRGLFGRLRNRAARLQTGVG